ncbi:TPA: phage tail tape measure protein [Escherichia coli]
MADNFQLKAIITAVDRLSGPLKGMQRQLKGFQKEVSSLALGAAGAGTAIMGALVLPVKSAITLESKMADVRKVVDGLDTPDAFKAMTEQVRDLSTELPMSAEGIAEIVAAGGQAGIARDELMQFATDAVKMGVAFDTTAEESGQMMAQWRTAFNMTQDEVAGLADKINYLGNTGPANAKKISDIVTRIGPLGGVAGVASGEIAAMGATIAGMGVESEIAATGIKNFMLSLTAGNSATKSQKQALRFLRINPKKLAADMQKDARGTMLSVLDAMAKVPKEKRAAVLNALFGKESLRELDPRTTTELINRWERLCGLPDECIPAGTQTLRQRQQRLDAKVNLAGGINEDFYLAQLAALGRPDATITRYDKSTFTCSSACTDAVNAPEWRYYWQVNMPAATNTTWMTCGDPCDSALRIWGDTVVECVLNKLCPSHTYVIFKYPE